MVTEIFSGPKLGSAACVAWCRVLFPDVRSSSSHPLDPSQYYLLQAIDVGLRVESEAMWEYEWRHKVTITRDHFKHLHVDWVLSFLSIWKWICSQTDTQTLRNLCPVHARWSKPVWSIPYVSRAFFPSLKHNFIAYRSSKVSSRPDCIFWNSPAVTIRL